MANIGAELKREREARGISLADIAASTKIGRRYLEALEEDRLKDLQGLFFMKGTIRAYAKAVGLDDQEVLRRYAEAGIFGRNEAPGIPIAVAGPSRLRAVVLAVLAIIAVAVLTVIISILLKPEPPAAPATIKETPLPESRLVIPPPPADLVAAPEATEPASPAVETKALVLDLEMTHETWIQVDADGTRVLDGLMQAGFRTRITAETEILMILGNAGGLVCLLNGKKVRSFGGLGAVVKNIRITPENLREHLAPDEGRNE
ncbi:MAG: DUF4115 domain-containing protein [Candidatus Aminicenantes bacterium]|nr:DUF4115 domain-containing protein [Candidatus Aminicenantes bacterium]